MRVAILVDEPPTTGTGKYAVNLRDAIRKNGIEADLLHLRWLTRPLEAVDPDAKTLVPSPFRVPFKSLEFFLSARAKDRVIPRGYDIYHAAQQFLVFMLPSFGRNILTFHDLAPVERPEYFSPLLTWEYRLVFDRVKRLRLLLADSQVMKRKLCDAMRIPDCRVSVANLGVSEVFRPVPRARESLHLPLDKRIIIHVGVENRQKSIPFLFSVFRQLCNQFDNMLMVRIGKMTRSSEGLIRMMHLEGKVMYLPGIPDEELSKFYSAADLFLFPSEYHPGPTMAVLEAMASGCPVIVSSAATSPEIIDGAGVCLPPNDLEAWVNAAKSLLLDENERERLKSLGLERAKKFTWQECATNTIQAYMQVLNT